MLYFTNIKIDNGSVHSLLALFSWVFYYVQFVFDYVCSKLTNTSGEKSLLREMSCFISALQRLWYGKNILNVFLRNNLI